MTRVAINGVRLNVVEMPQRGRRPDGLPIVMVHGLAASLAFWYAAGAQFMSLLGPCLAYDLRGHGKSEAPQAGYSVHAMMRDLEALLDDRGIRRAHLVAHSFGGMIALLYTLTHPDRVASLVLADVRIRPLQATVNVAVKEIPPRVARRLGELGIDIESVAAADDGIDYLKTVAKVEIAAGAEANQVLSALYSHPRLFRSAKSAERWIDLTERASLVTDLRHETAFGADDLKTLSQPMLILVGARSTTVPSAEALARLCPHAIVKKIPDVGHFFPVSHPQLFLRPALRFLNQANKAARPDAGARRAARV